ncbi:MAG: energy-coupling factor transporter ATPase [Clostridia bacterium]|nr:energy-coupling factor transporter ATPase [Clostridia bacterium]MBQ2318698.1 energy-coupling factor transporter ATPase [Clostridia bacterium]MBQ2387307.1 energy-coupling factor transporter ATPase [Clostridia bacterium]MBQ2420701.1 energy-coupling factor transporter ATPase [Clostridia bacterium]
MSILKAQGLTYVYGEGTPFRIAAITDVNFEINEPGLYAVIGHTGSGKSTLIQHLNGLIKPTSGTVFVDEKDIWSKNEKIRDVRFKVGIVFQYPEYQLFEETVRKDIAFGPRNIGLDEAEINERVMWAAKKVNLTDELLDKSPFELSGGEKRRAAIAGVLAMRPRVLILDEPTAGLDPKGRDVILKSVCDYQKQENAVVLLVSHSMEDVARVADKVLVMNGGKLQMFGKTAEVFSRHAELCEMGLNIPKVMQIVSALRERGADLPDGILTVADAEKAILRLVKDGGENA